MSMMNAALVESFDEPPHLRSVPVPQAEAGQELVDVLAVGISHATRGAAAGRHYTSARSLPVLAGIDAVVRKANGDLAFVMSPGSGTLAERIAVDPKDLVPVPRGADPTVVAATMNAALSSWVALRARVHFEPGQTVLVIGATGNAGSSAVRIAKHLGAARVVAAGRNRERLDALLAKGADELVPLTPDEAATAVAFAAAAAEVDVVLDYVWGPPAEQAMQAILSARTEHTRILDWVQVGGTGGMSITLGGHTLRHNALRISGSGFGSVIIEDADLPGLSAALASGLVDVRPHIVPLADVEKAWAHVDRPGERTVIVP
jgi:NADPH2:quinone reductase